MRNRLSRPGDLLATEEAERADVVVGLTDGEARRRAGERAVPASSLAPNASVRVKPTSVYCVPTVETKLKSS